MIRLVFPGNSYETLRASLLSFTTETAAILLATHSQRRLIVTERHPAPSEAYSARARFEAQLKPEFLVPLVKRAKDEGLAVVFCHTHPGDRRRPRFSSIDDEGEQHLAAFLERRVPGIPHAALVLSPGGLAARLLGSGEPLDVYEVGSRVRPLCTSETGGPGVGVWERQVRAFGQEGQEALRKARIAIVGCGGTGSVVAQQLAHLGVADFTLIDPDHIETTNLNRVVGASMSDVGRAKVDVTAEMIRRLGFKASVNPCVADVRDPTTAQLLTEADAIFGCTDSHASRAIINQVAYQYAIPTFDVGVAITTEAGLVSRVTGRAQMLAPGLACLVCGNALDWTEVRRELQTDAERSLDRYITGHNEPQPAVISLNSTVASLAVTMFMAAFAGVPAQARLQYYDGMSGRVRSAAVRPSPTCVVCSAAGALNKGGSWPLPTRATENG